MKFIPIISAFLFLSMGTAQAYVTPLFSGGGSCSCAIDSVNGQTGVVVLDTDDISEGATNLYFTNARARLACVDDAIVDGVTNKGPSQNAVFDALALKENLANKDIDGTLSANSDTRYPSQKAVKTYVDASVGAGITFPINAPDGTAADPSYNFSSDTGTDTGIYHPGDGQLAFSTNAAQALLLDPSQNATFSGTVAATNFIYPAKSANSFLAGPVSGGAAVPSFRAIQNGDISNAAIPFPLSAPTSTTLAPSYRFDSDTGMFSTGDGDLRFSANNVDVVQVSPSGVGVTGDLNVTGNFSAANYPPINTANTLAWFNASGDLDSLSQWGVDDLQYLTNITSIPGADTRTDFQHIRVQTNLNGTITGTARSLYFSLQGSGTTASLNGFQFDLGAPITGDANLLQMSSGSSATIGGNYTLSNFSSDSPVAGNFTGSGVYTSNTVGGSYNGSIVQSNSVVTGGGTLYHASNAGTIGQTLFMYSDFNTGAVTQDFAHANFGNNGDVGGFSRGVNMGENNNITKGSTAYSYYHNGNIGDGTGTNAILLDSNFNSGTIDGSVFLVNNASNATITGGFNGVNMTSNGTSLGNGGTGLNWNNSADFTANNSNLYLGNLNNSAPGYRLGGISINNTGNMTEEIRAFQFNDTGTARTKTAIDLTMQGNATDDVQAIRINMNNQTSTNAIPHSLDIQGGSVSISGKYDPIGGLGVEIGDRFALESNIPTNITGSDFIQQINQPILHVNATVGPGAAGIGVAGNALVPLLDVGSSANLGAYRGVIMAQALISGSGGIFNDYIGLDLAGLLPSGGSVITPKVRLLHDGIGSDYCNSATDCWGLQFENSNAHHYLGRLALGTSNQKTSNNVNLEVNAGHVRYTGTTPGCTPNANAGTGATCSVDGNDTIGRITLDTGTAAWAAGAQATIDFASAYNSAPVCVFSPANDNSAQATLNVSFPAGSTTVQPVNFVNPETAPTTYIWSYNCNEK